MDKYKSGFMYRWIDKYILMIINTLYLGNEQRLDQVLEFLPTFLLTLKRNNKFRFIESMNFH